MTEQRWTRAELSALIAARHGQLETQGEGAYLDFVVRVTPELLEAMLGGHWIATDGSEARFDGVSIDSDGLASPLLTKVTRAA